MEEKALSFGKDCINKSKFHIPRKNQLISIK